MPESEELYQQQLNEDQARQAKWQAQDRARQMAASQKTKPEKVPFPWLMLCVAVLFDLIGLIPLLNIFSELIAGFILWLWKTQYSPKTNPLIDIVAVKIVDFIFVGLLPSSMATVILAYAKRKVASKAQTAAGGKMMAKLAT